MRLIIVCGNEDCRKEYNTDTMDRKRECPHCGRISENKDYPFLSARLMQARIEKDKGDWEAVYEQMTGSAEVKVQERDRGLRRLEEELDVPEEDIFPDAISQVKALRTEDTADDGAVWRERSEAYMAGARRVLLAQEDRTIELEKEKRRRKEEEVKRTGD